MTSVDFSPDPDLFPFKSQFFDSFVGRVHYVDEGDGAPIVFFHGNPTWSFLYRDIVVRLRDRFRCIAVDYPGFGLSDRPAGYGYSAAEHARVIGELVDHLDLDGFMIMGQDWGGPIGTAIASRRAARVRGVILGNTWFWPSDRLNIKVFSTIMSSPPLQKAILDRNLFVERLLPTGMSRKLTTAEIDHYRKVQPTREARVGVAEFPRQLIAAREFLSVLARDVPAQLGSKPALIVWGMKDFAFRPRSFLPRVRDTFADSVVVELPEAKHYIQEDAPDQIAEAIGQRFG
ncbi:MAG: haloalkane dehalogenase [Actinomycetota bacterium]|nr:haloalkane dehalogenase [Actinomycetota bacterium]